MTLGRLFKKDINRNIETVIKADDSNDISNEVAEYVITDEISKKIGDFFSAYNDNTGINGVWISGFFGSGKSHLLKILSYVLEDKESDGYNCGEIFLEKIETDEMLKGDIRKAVKTPSESVLFNIDQQSQITSKENPNAILSVFYKVFYNHLGYYGDQEHVAEFEMWLDKKGIYSEFKEKFHLEHDKDWCDSRMDYFDPDVTETISLVLSEINESEPDKYDDILENIEDKYNQSIEDFSEKVATYISNKAKGFRLNFFVDEIGQYISENTKLMLNLQTIAESLATKTKGKSWILVTSQEDMEKVVGDMNRSQQNDFSRIQARFGIKIPLTSANVDEVIEKRLLEKNDSAKNELIGLWDKESSNIETLLSFSGVGIQFHSFTDNIDFANKYPFIPYQFDLFQQSIRALSNHNAFQGKHASVGERSMLGVFQQVIRNMSACNSQSIVSFNSLFEGIRNTIRGEIQTSISVAEKHIDDKFTLDILKALFLVKYYRNFKTTERNISVLMLNNLQQDIKEHNAKIHNALLLLENQSYVQRNGDIFEFLTDDEKDIEEDIKSTDIDDAAITHLYSEIIYDEILLDKKIRFAENKQDYEFSAKLDGAVYGREKELEIEFITPNSDLYSNIENVKAQTMGSTSMKVVLPGDDRILRDIKLYLKIEKYVKQNQNKDCSDNTKRILIEKSHQNTSRRADLKILLKKSISESTIYLNGTIYYKSSSSDGKTVIVQAFQDLVKIVYANLRMLGGLIYSEVDVKKVFDEKMDDLFGNNDDAMSEAEREILNVIMRRKTQSDRTHLSHLKDIFSKQPYGWYTNAIWTLVAKLYKRGKIELKQDSNILEENKVLNALLNNRNHNTTYIELLADIDPKKVKNLKNLYREMFDEACSNNDPKEVVKSFKDKLKALLAEIQNLKYRTNEYPFLSCLNDIIEKLDRLINKEYSYFLTDLTDFEDELLDLKEDVIDPVKRFMNGEHRKIFDSVRDMLKGDLSNLEYIDSKSVSVLHDLFESNKPYSGNLIREAKIAKDEITHLLLEKIREERDKTIQFVDEKIDSIKTKPEFSQLTDSQKRIILNVFETEKERCENQRFISTLIFSRENVIAKLYNDQLNEMMRLITPPEPTIKVKGEESIPVPKVHYIQSSKIHLEYTKKELASVEDVEEYLRVLKEAYLKQIEENRRINL